MENQDVKFCKANWKDGDCVNEKCPDYPKGMDNSCGLPWPQVECNEDDWTLGKQCEGCGHALPASYFEGGDPDLCYLCDTSIN